MIQSKNRTPGVIVAEVAMTRAAYPGVQLLLEGESDSRFWHLHCAIDRERVILCSGKSNAVAAIDYLDATGVSQVAALVDDDLDSILGYSSTSENLIYSAERDLESTIFASDALERVLNVIVPHPNLASFEKAGGLSFRDKLIQHCLVFAKYRFINRSLSLHVAVDDELRVTRYVDPNWQLDSARLRVDFLNLSGLSDTDLTSALGIIPTIDPWVIIHGHDALSICRIGIQFLAKRNVSTIELEHALYIAYTRATLEASRIRKNIAAWETKNNIALLCSP